mmetsp:Transcript_21480/g.74033  ORF Transcript_21480/g.74033 Transcript_21480/m.74033 type:complete len:212 (+) Transcript_21480:81-716(+)
MRHRRGPSTDADALQTQAPARRGSSTDSDARRTRTPERHGYPTGSDVAWMRAHCVRIRFPALVTGLCEARRGRVICLRQGGPANRQGTAAVGFPNQSRRAFGKWRRSSARWAPSRRRRRCRRCAARLRRRPREGSGAAGTGNGSSSARQRPRRRRRSGTEGGTSPAARRRAGPANPRASRRRPRGPSTSPSPCRGAARRASWTAAFRRWRP